MNFQIVKTMIDYNAWKVVYFGISNAVNSVTGQATYVVCDVLDQQMDVHVLNRVWEVILYYE